MRCFFAWFLGKGSGLYAVGWLFGFAPCESLGWIDSTSDICIFSSDQGFGLHAVGCCVALLPCESLSWIDSTLAYALLTAQLPGIACLWIIISARPWHSAPPSGI